MAEIIGSIPTKTIICVCISPASKEQIKLVFYVLKWLQAKILNENWIDHRKGDIYPVAWQRFTFEKHFVRKLGGQKQNRSSEDFWSKGKLRIIEGPLKPRKAGQGP